MDTRIPPEVQRGVIIGVVALGVLWLVARQVKAQLSTTLNPASDKNAAYTGVNAIGATLTGDRNFSLGVWIYDLFHPAPAPARAPAPSTPTAPNAEVVVKAQSDRQRRLDPTRPPSVMVPDRGGMGGSFEQRSSPDFDIYGNFR